MLVSQKFLIFNLIVVRWSFVNAFWASILPSTLSQWVLVKDGGNASKEAECDHSSIWRRRWYISICHSFMIMPLTVMREILAMEVTKTACT